MATRRIATTSSKYILTLLNVTTQPLFLERVLYAGGHFQTYLSSTAIWNQRNRGGGLISKAAMNSMLVINTLYSGLWLQIFPPPCSCSSCRQCLSLCAAKNSRSSGASWTFLQQESLLLGETQRCRNGGFESPRQDNCRLVPEVT